MLQWDPGCLYELVGWWALRQLSRFATTLRLVEQSPAKYGARQSDKSKQSDAEKLSLKEARNYATERPRCAPGSVALEAEACQAG